MPIPTVFSLDATILARQSNLTGLTSGDTLDVIVTVYGFDPIADTQVQWVFTAKVSPTDSDAAATTVQKTISPDPTGLLAAGIRSVALSPTALQGHFALSQADTAKLVNCTSYDVRVFITRTVNSQQVAYDRTVLRGTVSAAAGTTGTAVLFTGGATLSPAGAAIVAAGTLAGIGDVRNAITDNRLVAFWVNGVNQTLSGGAGVASLGDARGNGFGPALAGSGAPLPQYTAGVGIRCDGGQSYLSTAAQAAFGLNAVKCFFYVGTFEGGNTFAAFIVQDATIGSFSAQMRSNGVDVVANSPIGELDTKELASATPRLGVVTISNPLAGGASQYVSMDLPGGRIRKLQWDNLFGAGTKCVFIGHMGGTGNFAATTMIAAGVLNDYPTLADIQSLQRLAALYGATLTASRAKGIIGFGDSIMHGAGTTVPATKAFFNITAASLTATYDGSNTGRDGLQAQDIAGVISQIGAAAMNPLMTKIWVVVNAGINDLAAGRTAAQITADLQTIGSTLKAVGPHVKVCFCKILKDGGLSGGQETDRQTINTNQDGFIAGGYADAIYNAPADADPTNIADSADGLHPNDTANARMATALTAVLTAAGV